MLRSTPRPRLLRPGTRRGLTLIELLVVILIIGILMGILIPAVAGAMRAARQAQVTTEISNLATALADFKNKFGDYPPSQLYCAENGNYAPDSGDTANIAQLKSRSARYLRKFFPRMAINTNPSATTLPSIVPQGFYDFDGNGENESGPTGKGPYILTGPQCLVLFLGGITKAISDPKDDPVKPILPPIGFAMVGLAKSPTNPFITETGASTVNRIPPLYEFANDRLDGLGLRRPNDPRYLVPVYLDPLGAKASAQVIGEGNDKRPYAYFASYGGGSYDPNDYDAIYELDESLGSNVKRSFHVNFLPATSLPVASAGPNPYTTSGPIGGTKAAMTTASFANPESFQLLSAGIDRKWGIGGQFTGSGGTRLPWDPSNAFYDGTPYVSPTPPGNPRIVESDNISNFSGGRLD